MAKLVYSVISSLDGYFEDAQGKFDWAEPDEEVHAFANNLDRTLGTYLYGRRMYETMVFLETLNIKANVPPVYRDFAEIWRPAEKIVFSRTLSAPSSARTRFEREFEPDLVRQLKLSSSGISQLPVATSPDRLSASVWLMSATSLYAQPWLEEGNAALPDNPPTQLELIDDHRFGNGVVHLHYRVKGSS